MCGGVHVKVPLVPRDRLMSLVLIERDLLAMTGPARDQALDKLHPRLHPRLHPHAHTLR